MLMLKQNTTIEKRLDKKISQLNANNNNTWKYKVQAI